MIRQRRLLLILIASTALVACSAIQFIRGGLHRELDSGLTIVRLIADPEKYLDKEIVFSVRFYKKGDLPCPLGDDYVNFVIADRVSYITLDKVWINKDKSSVLDSFKENDTVIMKARVFRIDKEKDPNLEALEIIPE